ncbi:MAG: DUF3822 family protein [Muribaculaceae bacterium]|nr:DUF3822 family protein [Muribaculaceae bacterium]
MESPIQHTIDQPQQWNLCLRIGPDSFDALLFNPNSDLPMRGFSRQLPPQSELLPALETFVYDNPLLLNDFGSVTILLDTPRFTLAPIGAISPEICSGILSESLPDEETTPTGDTFFDTLSNPPLNIIFQPEEKLLTFLRRTFHNPKITHALRPLLTYFASRRKAGNHARTFVQIRQTSLDVIIFRENNLALCNRFIYSNISDAVYYILASRQAITDLDPDNDEIYICGDRDRRLELTPRLAEFIKNILPVIFPPALFRKARKIMQMPFDLLIMPLCE